MLAYARPAHVLVPLFEPARLIASARRSAPWIVGPAVLILRGGSRELADPSACPGLLELVAIGALRSRPGLAIGQLFDVLQIVVVTVALAALAQLVWRRTRRAEIAIAVAAAAGLGPLFPLVIAPPWEAAAFGTAAAAGLVVARLVERRHRSDLRAAALFVAACVAALVVPLWLLDGRAPAHGVAACLIPAASVARFGEVVRGVSSLLGTFALALALLGAFVETSRAGWRRALLVAAPATVVAMAAAGTAVSLASAAAPLLVLIWWLAAIGLDEVVRAIGERAAARVAAALIVVLVPTLSASRRVNEERDDWVRPRGHDRQTLRRITTVLNLVPQDAAFVVEDSTVDVLLRAAAFGGRRQAKPIAIVDAQPDAVAAAVSSRTVYAFPRRQEELSLRGFVVDPAGAGRLAPRDARELEGIAQITGRRTCQTIGHTWAEFNGTSSRIALNADSNDARGPAIIYLGGPSAGAPQPDGWSARMLRGFGYITLDRLSPAGVERMVAEARAIGLPETHPLFAETFVVRLNLHRTPRAPLGLPVLLGARFPVGVVRIDPQALDVGRLFVCDAPAVEIASLPASD